MLIVILLAALPLTGCNKQSADIGDRDSRGGRALAASEDHLVRAVETLQQRDRYDRQQARGQVISQLGQWIERQQQVADWSADPLTATLPQRFQVIFKNIPLQEMRFTSRDFEALGEAIWMRQVADWQVSKLRESDPEPFTRAERLEAEVRQITDQRKDLQNQLKQKKIQAASGDATQADLDAVTTQVRGASRQLAQAKSFLIAAQRALQLAKATWLFDWTMRNIQLDHTNWDAELPPRGETPAGQWTHPPGGTLDAGQALLLGHADAVTRARVFLLLCRQQQIDVVMLGLPRSDQPERLRTWVAGALIGGNVYLFEPELGLPFPAPDGAAVCALSQLRAHPELLRRFDTAEFPYHVQSDDLQHITPLIDASPQALSQRMKLIEQTLRADQRTVLTVAPSALAKRLRAAQLPDAKIWAAPYRVYAFKDWLLSNDEAAKQFSRQFGVHYPPFELWEARLHHFRGQIDEPAAESDSSSSAARGPKPEDYVHGARHYYLKCRNPERELQSTEQELAKWFEQNAAKPKAELIAELQEDMRRYDAYTKRRQQLKSGDIDPAEQYYRRQMESDAIQRDPEKAADLARSQDELTSQEMKDFRRIEARLSALSPATRDWIKRLSIDMLRLDDQQRGDVLAQFKDVAANVKDHATWWLGVLAMEEHLGAAAGFLEQPLLQDDPNNPWREHAQHMLGRYYEQSGQGDKAIEHYRADQSAQRAGSLVRAARLAKQD